ncbi:MAG: VOC family protein [Rhizobium sp.]|nr:VOC family protein [Rhizobium sp.]
MTSGLHHITGITRNIQANVDFYVGFLGLRLVKRTAGFEDAAQLHLFYGDNSASPGTLVTFLAWEGGSPGRVGHGAPSEISFAIRPAAIGFWVTRALNKGVAATGPAMEFGEPVLRLTDPDGIIVKLVGVDDLAAGDDPEAPGIGTEDALVRLRGATILSESVSETAAFLERHMGFRRAAVEGTITRLASDAGDVLDVRDAGGFWPAIPGTGTIDHVAVRAIDRKAVEAVGAALADAAAGVVNMHDRTYFYSLYVREPGGTLIELASDGPGFALDEAPEALGATLFVPAHFKRDDADVVPALPQFGLPGEPRIIYRDLPFVHRIHEADVADGSTLMLLHGTGGNEADMLPFGRAIAPHAMLIGMRGRATEEGTVRFFRRFSETVFDQADIIAEAQAFAAFLEAATAAYGIDPGRLAFAGNSNGANMLAAAMRLYPGQVRKAVLIRPADVLEQQPEASLVGTSVLVLVGRRDPYRPQSEELAARLGAMGAAVTTEMVEAGHEISPEDRTHARRWLSGRN